MSEDNKKNDRIDEDISALFDVFGGNEEKADDTEELPATGGLGSDEALDIYTDAEMPEYEYIEVPRSLLDRINGEAEDEAESETAVKEKGREKKRKKRTRRDALRIPSEDDTAAKLSESEKPIESDNPTDAEENEKKVPCKSKQKKSNGNTDKKRAEGEAEKKSSEKNAAEISKTETDAENGEEPVKPVSSARLVIVLTAICASVALLLSVVNYFTEARIAENTQKTMLRSIQTIFDGSVQAEELRLPADSEISAAYLVMKDGNVCGYSALTEPTGFGGALSLMVGVDYSGAVVGVRIISMSETPGLGSRVGSEEFLSSFNGKSGEISVDVISGASISSTAVISGVNSVTSNLLDLEALAAERGASVIPFVRTENVPVTATPSEETATVRPPETELPDTVVPTETEAETVIPEVTKGEAPAEIIVKNPNKENSGISVEYTYDTAEYETLTTEPETDTESADAE